jgi:uncharacterized cupin superfamily protein
MRSRYNDGPCSLIHANMPAITDFRSPSVQPEYDHPREERRLAGNPRRTTWNHFTNASGEVNAGVWACEKGSWRIHFAPNKDEYFYVLEGRCRVIDEQGHAAEAGPGDALVIPAGFKGVFEVVEPTRKHYVIVERKA